MIDYNDIKQTIAENLPDNNRREITAARLRDTLDGFVDKVQVTETDLEGKVSSNETNIGNLSGRVDSLSGEVSGLSGRVDDLSGSIGNVPRIVDNPIKGGANDVASMKWDTTIAAIAGLYTAESLIGGNALKINKVSVIDGGYVKFDGTIVRLGGYSYFEYTLLKKNGYITIPAQEYGAVVATDGGAIGFAFYDKDGNVISYNRDIIDWQFSGQLELKVPYGATMIRASLINGVFDPDNLYVIESAQPNNCNQLCNLRWKFNECTPTVDYLAKIGTDGKPVIDGSNWLSVIKLLAGDELEAEIGYGEGVQLAIGDSRNIDYTKTVVYQEKPSTFGLIYYKADKDCYAFISEPSSFKVVRGNRFDRDMYYRLLFLATYIKPLRGYVLPDSDGKGVFNPKNDGKWITFKVPIVSQFNCSYNLSGPSLNFTLMNICYWYSGQPVPTASVNTQITFSNGVLRVENAAYDDGYALVSFAYADGDVIPDDIFRAIELRKKTN